MRRKFQISNMYHFQITQSWKHLKFNTGFTLLELIIYTGMLMILMGVLATLFGTILETRLESSSYSTLQQDGNFIFSRLTYDLERSSSVITPATVGISNSTLQVIINDSNGPLYTYSVDGSGNLQVSNGLGTNQLNSFGTSISNFRVLKLGDSVPQASQAKYSYQITFNLISRTNRFAGGTESRDFTTTINLRNN